MKIKHISFVALHGFSLRMLTQTDLLGKLKKSCNVSLILGSKPGVQLEEYLAYNKINYYILSDNNKYDEYYFARKYFFKDYESNIALKEKHIRAAFYNKTLHPWKRIRPFVYNFLHKISRFIGLINLLFNKYEKRLLVDVNYEKLLATIDPDLLVSTYPVDLREAKCMYAAKNNGAKTLIHLLSWDNISTKGNFPVLADYYFAWGEVMLNELFEYYNVPDSKVYKCGVPHFDLHFSNDTNINIKEFINTCQLKVDVPYVIFGMSAPVFAPHEIDIVEWMAEQIETDKNINLQLIVRPHPQNIQGQMADKSWLPRLHKLNKLNKTSVFFPKLTTSNIPWDMDYGDMPILTEVIKHSSAVFNTCSTFSIDGMMNHKPILMTNFDGNENLNYWTSARRMADFPHLKKFIKTTRVKSIKNYNELYNVLIDDFSVTYSEDEIKAYNIGYDGNATNNCLESYKDIINQNSL